MPHKRAKRSVREAETKAKGYNLAPSQSKEYDDTPRGASRIFNSINFQTQFRASGRTNSEDTGEKSKKRKAPSNDSSRPQKKGEPSTGTSKPSTSTTGPESRATTITSQDSKPSRKGKEKESLPKIRDNESLGDYNRRIESLLRPGVAKAIKSANSVRTQQVRDAKEAKQRRKQGIPDPALATTKDKATDSDAKSKSTTKPGDEKEKSNKSGGGGGGGGKVHDVSDPAKEFKSTERRRLNDIVQAPPMLAHLKKGMGPGGKKKNSGGETSAWKATGRTPLNAGQERILNAERERVVKAYREIKAERELKRAAARAAESKK